MLRPPLPPRPPDPFQEWAEGRALLGSAETAYRAADELLQAHAERPFRMPAGVSLPFASLPTSLYVRVEEDRPPLRWLEPATERFRSGTTEDVEFIAGAIFRRRFFDRLPIESQVLRLQARQRYAHGALADRVMSPRLVVDEAELTTNHLATFIIGLSLTLVDELFSKIRTALAQPQNVGKVIGTLLCTRPRFTFPGDRPMIEAYSYVESAGMLIDDPPTQFDAIRRLLPPLPNE